MNNQKTTFLGPFGSTFSHEAYGILAKLFHAPEANEDTYTPAISNRHVINLIAEHGGYGVFAFETMAEGFLVESFDALINLINIYKEPTGCPFNIIGAIQLQIHFVIMARPGTKLNSVKKIIAHPNALGACKKNIVHIGLQTISATSNGEAARLVAKNDKYKNCVALGPKIAAEKYGLEILTNSFEDETALTTFHLIGPKTHLAPKGKENCVILVFKVPNLAESLLKSLTFLKEYNIIKIHSGYSGKETYYIGLEIKVTENELPTLNEVLVDFSNYVHEVMIFGPFSICR